MSKAKETQQTTEEDKEEIVNLALQGQLNYMDSLMSSKIYDRLKSDVEMFLKQKASTAVSNIHVSLQRPDPNPFDIVIEHPPPPYSADLQQLLRGHRDDPRFFFQETKGELGHDSLVRDVKTNDGSTMPWDITRTIQIRFKTIKQDVSSYYHDDEARIVDVPHMIAEIVPAPLNCEYKFYVSRDGILSGWSSSTNVLKMKMESTYGICECHQTKHSDRVDFFIEYYLPRFAKRRIYLGHKMLNH